MNILVASDSFKGSLSSMEVAQAVTTGMHRVFPQARVLAVPMADGGEGTVQALVAATGGKLVDVKVTGPLGTPVTARFGWLPDSTAVLEMAAASGLTLVPEEKRDPTITTTFGTGELIKAALDRGASKIVMGIGGSATNDGGAGMFQALGGCLLDETGRDLGFGGGQLDKLHKIEDPVWRLCWIPSTSTVSCSREILLLPAKDKSTVSLLMVKCPWEWLPGLPGTMYRSSPWPAASDRELKGCLITGSSLLSPLSRAL